MTLQRAVDGMTKALELERCKHGMVKVTCSYCSSKQIAAKQQERKVETRSLQRTARCKELVGSLDLDVFTLGFLAARGYLYFGMPESYADNFRRDYRTLAELDPDDDCYNVSTPSEAGNDRWAIGGRIGFRLERSDEDQVDFGEFEMHQDTSKEKRYYIANTAFCWVLVALGFKLGKQDINRIRLRLDPKDVPMFDQGVLRGVR